MESYEDVLYVHVMVQEIKRTCHHVISYILQIMLYQSLKSIHYRTLLIFQNKKKPTDLRVKTWGGGIKDMLSPMSKHGGGFINPIPQDLRPWPYFEVNPPAQQNS